ncbi:putative oocyte-secreted protein 1 homolog [Notamacropus eugenii]|uniref:putative oocyte-secreted protein 1 homolog n=1 Tax=Notamacropus eugenii TaxID=9315 RepID=UPI003B671944
MMKVFLELGVLYLLVCLTWSEQPVTVECTLFMFRVLVKKDLFGDGVPVRPEELTLGMGCPVNGEMTDKFELYYSVTECGIENKAFEMHVMYKTDLHYVSLYPVFGRGATRFPLSCQVFRQLGPKTSPRSDVPNPPVENRRVAVRIFPAISGPIYWTPELLQTLEKQWNRPFLKKEFESWNWVSLPILTLSSVVCLLLCHGDMGLSAS